MNESTEELLARLEQATASETTEPLDEDTARLRESWLVLGRLLEAADSESEAPAVRRSTVRQAGLAVRVVMGLAASLFVAFAAWAILRPDADSAVPSQELITSAELTNPDSAVANRVESPRAAEPVDEFGWDDSFDERLASTSEAIRSAQADWTGGDERYSIMLDQFEQFHEELSEGSL